METKLIAAEIATAAGVTTIVTSSKDPKNIFKIIEYNTQFKSGANTPLTGMQSGRSSPEPASIQPSLSADSTPSSDCSITPTASSENVPTISPSLERPPHTVFVPSVMPLRDLKSWTSHTLFPSGTVIIDSGAHSVLSKRESGGRLLAAGVLGVRGAFASGQAVRIAVRKRRPDDSTTDATAEDNNSPVSDGAHSVYHADSTTTEPNTPEINPAASLSSSISSISSVNRLPPLDEEMTPSTTLKPLPEEDTVVIERDAAHDSAEWELEEVGRGLANYNSAQIDRVKGLRR